MGKPLARETVFNNFKRVVRQLGWHETRFHDLRHRYAVASLQSGDSVKTVQENLGHHTAAFTLDIYGHVSERMQEESAQRMDQYLKAIRAAKKSFKPVKGKLKGKMLKMSIKNTQQA